MPALHGALRLAGCLACLVFALAACRSLSAPGPNAPRVETTSGDVLGHTLGSGVSAFLGIPFAAPPIGPRRWAPPAPAAPWDEARRAADFAPACPQGDYTVSWYADLIAAFGGDPGQAARPVSESEDCLYLNVWRPDAASTEPKPVMVWIYGGAFKGGWSYEPNYIGATLAEQDVVVVSIAYRVGPFGYLGPDGMANFGLMDQIAALEWVQANISQFGGDPGNVTLFGESAGAASIGTLLVTPGANALFHRAIHQSAGFEFISEPDTPERTGAFDRLAGALAPTVPEAATTRDVLDTSNRVLADHWFAPSPEQHLLPGWPVDLLAEASLADVDLMIGTNLDEWLMYLDPDTAMEELSAWRARLPGARAIIDTLEAELGTLRALDRVETADQMRCPGRQLMRAVSDQGGRVFAYRFTRVRLVPTDPELGSYHGAEIPYVFGTHDPWLPTDPVDTELTATMMGAWVAFARSGDPNSAVAWPEFGATGEMLELGDKVGVAAPLDYDLCAHIRAARESLQ